MLWQAFSEGPWSHSNLDAGATMIIPVPAPLGGAIVVGESVITYFSKGELKTVPLEQTTVRVRPHLLNHALADHKTSLQSVLKFLKSLMPLL